jgi:hypothetical protein
MTQPMMPTFEPRSTKDGDRWSALVSWPNGEARRIHGFPSEQIALEWIEKASGNWLHNFEKYTCSRRYRPIVKP